MLNKNHKVTNSQCKLKIKLTIKKRDKLMKAQNFKDVNINADGT